MSFYTSFCDNYKGFGTDILYHQSRQYRGILSTMMVSNQASIMGQQKGQEVILLAAYSPW